MEQQQDNDVDPNKKKEIGMEQNHAASFFFGLFSFLDGLMAFFLQGLFSWYGLWPHLFAKVGPS